MPKLKWKNYIDTLRLIHPLLWSKARLLIPSLESTFEQLYSTE